MEAENTERLTGTVLEFKTRNGFGFIKRDDNEEKLFVHWKEIKTDDRWPQLPVGMAVEFAIKKANGKQQATGVTALGGENISADAQKTFTSDQYTGKVKFFDTKKGFGFITPDSTIEFEGNTSEASQGIYVTREEIITDDEPPALNEGEKVAFYVYTGEKGLGAGKVTQADGSKIVYKSSGKRRRPWGYRGQQSNRRPYRGMPMHGDNNMIEVGLHVENKYVGGLIGKGGEAAKALRAEFGARIQFGDSRIGRGPDAKRVLSVIGEEESVTNATIAISTKIAESDENHGDASHQKLVFLIPDSYCGMFIGKGGSFLKQVRENEVQVQVSNNPVALPAASMVSTATVTGGPGEMAGACKVIIPKLGQISRRVREDAMTMAMNWGPSYSRMSYRGYGPPMGMRKSYGKSW